MPGGRPRAKTQADTVKSVTKVLDILEHLGAAQRVVSVSDLARATGLNVSTAFRLLQTLMARGYVEQERSNRGYFLGPRFFQMGSAYLQGSDLATIARPHLEALRDAVGETAYLVIFSQGEIVQLCKADGKQAVSAAIRSMVREPAYCTATGKVLLSALRGRGVRQIRGERRAGELHAADPDQQGRSCGARSRKSRQRLCGRQRGVRAESVLRQRSGAAITTAAPRSRRSASRCRRCASRRRWCRAGASSCGRRRS